MAKYENIIPENLTANQFEYHNSSIEIECDGTYYADYPPWCFFNQNYNSVTPNTPPRTL